MAASASATFVAADVSMAVGVGIDVGVALAHPTPANRAVVVGDLAIGYGIGKAIGAAVSKFGPTVAEMFAQRAAQKAAMEAVEMFRPATFEEFCGTVSKFENSANEKLARQSYKLYEEKNWQELETVFNENQINEYDGVIWPPNRGFVGVSETTLPEKLVFDRYGGKIDADGNFVDSGRFVAPAEVEFPARALPESTKLNIKSTYEVVKPIPGVKMGQAIPWLGQPGMGIQYELPKGGIDALLKGGYIKKIPNIN